MIAAAGSGGADVEGALDRLETWLEREGFAGWDPHDALNSPWIGRLARLHRLVGIALLQAVRRSPVNLRPLLGVPKGLNPKAMGLFLAAYLRRRAPHGTPGVHPRASFFAEWLRAHTSPGHAGACWGYNFAWPNRGFRAEAGAPTIVATAFIGLALIDAGDAGLPGCLACARSACDFICVDLPRDDSAPNDECAFGYVPHSRRFIHNANVLGAALLAEVAARTGETALGDLAVRAARYTVRRQRPDGSWWYGVDRMDHWIDNFHTGYVLVALRQIGRTLRIREFDAAVERGYRFWIDRMFTPGGLPKYYADRVYPIDIHVVAQAILTSVAFRDLDPDASARAERLSAWAIAHLQDRRGYFHYQVHRFYRNRIPYLRWSQAWMHRALSEVAWARRMARADARPALATAR